MFKAVQFMRIISRLGENFLQKSNKQQASNFKNNINLNYVKCSFYCSNSQNTTVIEGINEGVNINDIAQGDSEIEKKLRVIVLETDVLKQDGSNVPDTKFLKTEHWKELLSKQSKSARRKYLTFLFKLEKKKENDQRKKEKRREELANRPDYVDDGHIRYGLNHNTFLIRIYDSTMNQLYNSRLINAIMYGQKLVIDCSYDEHMVARESKNCAKQLMLLFSENRMHDDPFDLHLCNAPRDAPTIKALNGHIATMYEPDFPLHVHKESYLDLFPKENLVYLTPHCREELTTYDHDAVYIIGGIVDKINQEPLSLAKAKKEGLKMARLPLDRYLQWGAGSGKSLTLNCMLRILLDIKSTGDWSYALRHVPKRKVADEITESKFKRAPKDRIGRMITSDKFSLRYDRSDEKKYERKNRPSIRYDKDEEDIKYEKKEKKIRNKDFVSKLLNKNT